MLDEKEKRTDERFAFKADIIYSYFSTKNWDENHSMALNISAGGMCFESRFSFKPHANLYIRSWQSQKTISRIGNCNVLRMSTLAEVRWCRKIDHKDGTWYSVGVKYF